MVEVRIIAKFAKNNILCYTIPLIKGEWDNYGL